MADRKNVLPSKIDKLLATASEWSKRSGRTDTHRLIVNSRVQVFEDTHCDSWNGGRYGHSLILHVAPELYFDTLDSIDTAASEIKDLLTRFNPVSDEWIAEVTLEIDDDPALDNWREKSGALIRPGPAITATETDLARLWAPNRFRLFISHKCSDKILASQLKTSLAAFGVTCFVAHEDIHPSTEWLQEIERALFSMDALVALVSTDFHTSNWTNQEVGVAIGRRILVLSVRLGADPHGFIGKHQAIAGVERSSDELADGLVTLLLEKHATRRHMLAALINEFCDAQQYIQANKLIRRIHAFSEEINHNAATRMKNAFETNRNLTNGYVVQDLLPEILHAAGLE